MGVTLKHGIEDMTTQDLRDILLSPWTPADYKIAALDEQLKRKKNEICFNETPIRSLHVYPHLR